MRIVIQSSLVAMSSLFLACHDKGVDVPINPPESVQGRVMLFYENGGGVPDWSGVKVFAEGTHDTAVTKSGGYWTLSHLQPGT